MRFFRLPFAFGGLGSRCLSSVGLFGLFERGACSQEPQSSCALHSCCRGFVASRAHGAGENLLDASFTAKLLETNEYFKGINLSQVKIGKLFCFSFGNKFIRITFHSCVLTVKPPHCKPVNLPFLRPAASSAQDREQFNGARPDCQRTLQLFPAAPSPVPLHRGR